MLVRCATVASGTRRAPASAPPWVGMVALALGAGCGTPNPGIIDATEEARGVVPNELDAELSEQDKIHALIERVRRSEHVFVHEEIERTGKAAANKLQLLLERDPTGMRNAREFIERVAAPQREGDAPDRVVLSEEESMLARYWYETQLAEIEGRPAPPTDPDDARQAQEHARRLAILDALRIVENSEHLFVAPPRRVGTKPIESKPAPTTGARRTRKPKRKEYTGPQFADMLRTKWEYLGADIEQLDTFIDEIASASFTSLVRYRVVKANGSEEDFEEWLREQLATERLRLARGDAPR